MKLKNEKTFEDEFISFYANDYDKQLGIKTIIRRQYTH